MKVEWPYTQKKGKNFERGKKRFIYTYLHYFIIIGGFWASMSIRTDLQCGVVVVVAVVIVGGFDYTVAILIFVVEGENPALVQVAAPETVVLWRL